MGQLPFLSLVNWVLPKWLSRRSHSVVMWLACLYPTCLIRPVSCNNLSWCCCRQTARWSPLLTTPSYYSLLLMEGVCMGSQEGLHRGDVHFIVNLQRSILPMIPHRISKTNLALMYFPMSTPATARRHLMSWIAKCQPLVDACVANTTTTKATCSPNDKCNSSSTT